MLIFTVSTVVSSEAMDSGASNYASSDPQVAVVLLAGRFEQSNSLNSESSSTGPKVKVLDNFWNGASSLSFDSQFAS